MAKKLILSCDQVRLKKSKWRRFCTLQYILMLERRNITFDKVRVVGLNVVDMITRHSKLVLKLPLPQKRHFLRKRYFFIRLLYYKMCFCFAKKTICLLLKNTFTALDLY
jgi:hypothetical protein